VGRVLSLGAANPARPGVETALPVAPTEVEVRFLPDGDGTRVELEHRGWERVGAEAAEVHEAYGSPQGWATTLNVYAAAIEQEVA
jgi:uncharacterized protein YndB with AHSA1/START domain